MMPVQNLARLVAPSKTALVIVDVQNDFCHPDGVAAQSGHAVDDALAMIPTLQSLIAAARAHGTSVIFIQTIHEPSTDSESWIGRRKDPSRRNCLKGSWGAEFTDIAPLASEPVVIKHRYSAFLNTRLDSVLRTLKAENIIVCGVATNVCVESTSRHGFMLDYNVVFASDCSAAYDREAHDMTLRNHARHFGTVATAAEIAETWAQTHSVAATI